MEIEMENLDTTAPLISNSAENSATVRNDQSRDVEKNVAATKSILKLEDAFNSDDLEEFEKLLKQTSQTDLFVTAYDETGSSFFETILGSDISKNAKYISLILMFHKLFSDEDFYGKVNSQKKTLMFYVLESKNKANFLSYLMPDWFNPISRNDQTYALVTKSKQLEGKKLLEELYKIIDAAEKNYQDASLRIVYQFLHELELFEADNVEPSKQPDFEAELCIEKAFEINHQESKVKVLQILMVYSTGNKFENADRFSEEDKTFFELANFLKKKQSMRFQGEFQKFIEVAQKTHGSYYKVAIKPQVWLLSKIAKRQKMLRTVELLFHNCPFIDIGSTIMTSFYDVQDFKAFIIYPFRNKMMKKLVKKMHKKFELRYGQ